MRLKLDFSVLTRIIKCVSNNINKRINIILEDWELHTSSTTITSRISNLKEYLQKDLGNDEYFSRKFVKTFNSTVLSMNNSQ